MSEKPVSLSDKIARLRGIFIERLPGKMAEAREFVASLRLDPSCAEAAEQLHRHLHSIKGTGASLGLLKLSELAGEGEDCATQILESPDALTSEHWQRMDECIGNIERIIQDGLTPDNPA